MISGEGEPKNCICTKVESVDNYAHRQRTADELNLQQPPPPGPPDNPWLVPSWLFDAINGPLPDAVRIVLQSYDELPGDVQAFCSNHFGREEVGDLRILWVAADKLRRGILPGRDELDRIAGAKLLLEEISDGFRAVADLEPIKPHLVEHLNELGDRLEEASKALHPNNTLEMAVDEWASWIADKCLPLRPGEKRIW